MLRSTSSAALVVLALVASCGEDPAPTEAPGLEPVVYTTFYPTQYFAQRIAGGAVEVICPLPEEADPIFWQPDREHLAAYQSASLIVLNGAEFEKWVTQASLPPSRLVDSAAAFEDRFLEFTGTTHSHGGGAGGEHTHEGIDGHTWLDPTLAVLQARAIAAAMVRAFPDDAEAFGAGLAALESDLDALDGELRALTPQLEGTLLLASHPAYDYLARRCEWTIENFDLDPGAPLSAEAFATLSERAADGRRVLLLWESEPLEETRARLTEVGVQSVLFSPCELLSEADRQAGQDYLSVMRSNIARIEGL